MVDETEFRETLRELNLVHCVFEKTILNNHYPCRFSHRHLLAGREIAGCKNTEARDNCVEVLSYLRHCANFALKIMDKGKLPHGKAIRVQVGGLHGLGNTLDPQGQELTDINALVTAAITRFDTLDEIPAEQIVRGIAEFKGRQKKPKRS
ncbi:MAG TPA: hypothetical protein EYN73_03485 [Chromatiaceae bacterium]|jgi:hypothetical protein|nr:hypothetical protein [Chromatiaceae bacterium]HIN82664.1 hypothetical protein [Chromatiales bacterium]HIA08135.1 hypothetical protein [Chromatiaceae bacterium]HIB84041.1 hypothetical protein [Chromatiaceae bacterium]HIO14484.1 hypothetical protein [Chromatiales bacterium]